MKKLLISVILLLFVTKVTQAQFRAPEKEYLIFNIHLDYPKTNNPEANKYALQFNPEIGIQGNVNYWFGMEAKVGIDSFKSMYGGYFAYTGSIGIRMTSGREEEWQYYVGWRASKVYRTSDRIGKSYRWNNGLELKLTRDIIGPFYGGLRYTLDEAIDQQIFDWPVETRWALWITIGIKILDL